MSAGDALVLSNGDSDQGPSVATDTNNTPYVLFMDGTVARYRRLRPHALPHGRRDLARRHSSGRRRWRKQSDRDDVRPHTPELHLDHERQLRVPRTRRRTIEFGYQYQLGGLGANWGPFATLDPRSATNPGAGDTVEPGTDGSASVRFDPLRDNNTNIIDVIYFDERDNSDASHHHATVYYKAIVIGTG